MADYAVDKMVDCQGLSCPMPIVKTKRAMEEIHPGQVLGVIATDPGSVTDVKSWAARTGHHFLRTEEQDGVYRHYIRRAHPGEVQPTEAHAKTITNDKLLEKLTLNPVILDVREPDEYRSGHIPGSQSVPLGQLEHSISLLKPYLNEHVYVVCRSGSRSDFACSILTKHGFQHAVNAVEGMKNWHGPTVVD